MKKKVFLAVLCCLLSMLYVFGITACNPNGSSDGKVCNHNYEYTCINETMHRGICSECNGKIEEQHLFSDSRCVKCGYEKVEENLPVPTHKHTLQHTQAKAAKCGENGNVEYWYCTGCEKYFREADCVNEIKLSETVISAAHTAIKKTDAHFAGCEEIGNIEYWYCSDCGKYYLDSEFTVETTKEQTEYLAGHKWKDNVCSECELDAGGSKKMNWKFSDNFYTLKGLGECTDEEIVIPSIYNGYPVKAVEFGALEGAEIKSLTLPFIGAASGVNENGKSHYGYIFGANSYFRNSDYVPETLQSVVITGGETIGEYAFYNCRNLESVSIPETVTSIDKSAFSACDALTAVYIDNLSAWCNIAFFSYNSNPLTAAKNLYLNGELITDLVIPSDVTEISDSAFYNCLNLKSLVIPEGVETLGNSAFYGCGNLVEVSLPDSLNNLGSSVFSGCSSLKYTEAGNAKYLGNSGNPYLVLISQIDKTYTFCNINAQTRFINDGAYSRSSITSVTIPDSVISIGGSVFEGSTLAYVTVGSGVKKIGYCAFASRRLESLNVAAGNSVYHSSGNCIIVTETKELLVGCGYSNIPSNGSVTSIADNAFGSSTVLRSIRIPDTVTKIGDAAFWACIYLSSVTLGSGLERIERQAFLGSGIRSITIPASVNYIGGRAFAEIADLTSVKFENTSGWRLPGTDMLGNITYINVSNSSQNATYFSTTYSTSTWVRE